MKLLTKVNWSLVDIGREEERGMLESGKKRNDRPALLLLK